MPSFIHCEAYLTSGRFIPANIILPTRKTLLLTGLLAGSLVVARAQRPISDSQVEANVLKALAGAPDLANEVITTHTVYGTVTLSGSVRDEAARRKAENITANTEGVLKVVDELKLATNDVSNEPSASSSASQSQSPEGDDASQLVLQSDGTYGPASAASASAPMAQRNNPEADQELNRQREAAGGNEYPQQGSSSQVNQPYANGGTPPISRPSAAVDQYPPSGQGPYAPSGQPVYPSNQAGYPPNDQSGYPPNNQPAYPVSSQPAYSPNGQAPYPPNGYPREPIYGGQIPDQPVTIPSGALVRVRINRNLSSDHSQPGSTFDGIVTNDVVAGGFIAIPRGATVQGRVIDAKSSGVLKGRGEMSVQLTQVFLGGRPYPLVSDIWEHHGGDKTTETINKTAGFGAAGAVIGALAGGGVGAAVGGGIGAAAGLGSSAASGNGQVYIPAEGMLTFHLAQPALVETVSESEMQRLAYGSAPGADQRNMRRRVYVGPGYPGYYPGPYGPYGPYAYPR